MRKHKGFSLIELLIVVAIILIIAAIAIPNLLRSRISANEASAVSSLRQINTAQTAYSISFPTMGFADSLTKLAEPPPGVMVSPAAGGMLDWVLGCAAQPCRKGGYEFAINVSGRSYTATATPVSANEGRYGDGVARYSSVRSQAPPGQSGDPVR